MTGAEPHDIRLKRLSMRAMRRGIKEMDVILSAFADAHLRNLTLDQIDQFEALLQESDLDILSWVLGTQSTPQTHAQIIGRITDHISVNQPN